MNKRLSYKPIYPVEPIPCLSPEAISALEEIVVGKEVLEIGSGGSTLWLAQRVSKLVSLEDDADWYHVVARRIDELDLEADLRLVSTNNIHTSISGIWDVIFVDPLIQLQRKLSIIASMGHVKGGGWLVADDYDFPMVAQGVDVMRSAGWDVRIITGEKLHPVRKVLVSTSAAFCRKPEK